MHRERRIDDSPCEQNPQEALLLRLETRQMPERRAFRAKMRGL
jgi:hypothetical protein